MSDKVFAGDYTDIRVVKGRKIACISIEIPLEHATAFVAAFGMPNPATGVPVALARIDPNAAQKPTKNVDPPAKGHRSWDEMHPAQQAGIRCGEMPFVRFLIERHGHQLHDNPADTVRAFCGVTSRAELNTSKAAADNWKRLDDEFVLWQRYPELAA